MGAPLEAELDHRLGWRWLLPVSPHRAVATAGFGLCEQQALRAALQHVVGDGASDDLLVVDLDAIDSAQEGLTARFAHAEAVALIGNAHRMRAFLPLLHGFSHVRHYGMLPAGRPRVLVPLARPAWTRAALALHRPGRRLARLAIGITRALASIGMARPVFRRQLCIATRIAGQPPCGAGDAGLSASPAAGDFAVYLGTPDANRKTVVLPLGDHMPDRIVKIARTEVARASLQREVIALRHLADSPLADQVPRILQLHESGETLALHIEYRPRSSRLAPAGDITSFLATLAATHSQDLPIKEWMSDAALPHDPLTTALAQRGLGVRLCRVHGDFAPWNYAPTRQGLFVFDWETSREDGLALADAMHAVLAPALLIGGPARPAQLLRRMLAAAQPVAERIGLPRDSLLVQAGAFVAHWGRGRVEPLLVGLRHALVESLR